MIMKTTHAVTTNRSMIGIALLIVAGAVICLAVFGVLYLHATPGAALIEVGESGKKYGAAMAPDGDLIANKYDPDNGGYTDYQENASLLDRVRSAFGFSSAQAGERVSTLPADTTTEGRDAAASPATSASVSHDSSYVARRELPALEPGVSYEITGPVMRQYIQAFYEAFLRRPLSGREADQAIADEVVFVNRRGITAYSTNSVSKFGANIRILRDDHGTAGAAHLRDIYIAHFAFDQDLPNLSSGKLVLGYDPIVVKDAKSRRVVTVSDVRALIQLYAFAHTDMDPNDIGSPSGADLNQVQADIKKAVANGESISPFSVDAGAYWLGTVKQWRSLSASEKNTVREYAYGQFHPEERTMTSLPAEMYMPILGWTKTELMMAQLQDTIRAGMIANQQNSMITAMGSMTDSFNTAAQNLVGPMGTGYGSYFGQ